MWCWIPPPMARQPPVDGSSHFTITLIHTTLVRTPLDKWSVRRRDLHLTTHNTQKWETYMAAGFETAIPASEQPQTQALDRAATGTGNRLFYWWIKFLTVSNSAVNVMLPLVTNCKRTVFVVTCGRHVCDQLIWFNKKHLILRKLLEQDRGICCAFFIEVRFYSYY